MMCYVQVVLPILAVRGPAKKLSGSCLVMLTEWLIFG
jgi:hypothetical protein